MKRSLSVPMVFLGTLGGLTGCCDAPPPTNTEVQIKQDFYTSREDCQSDWGIDPQNCQRTPDTTAINGQDMGMASSGKLPGNSLINDNTSSLRYFKVVNDKYAGPRYFWYRHEQGGYPMAIQQDGQTRPIMDSRIPQNGAQFASQSIHSRQVMPTHQTAAPGVLRGGFGCTGRRFGLSSGG